MRNTGIFGMSSRKRRERLRVKIREFEGTGKEREAHRNIDG